MNYILQFARIQFKSSVGLLSVLFYLVSLSVYAQGTVSGKITDENGESLPGVTIKVQGTTDGTITDFEGNYSLSAESDAVLEVTSVGYVTQVIELNGRTSITVTMQEDVAELGELVVVGYGSVQKSDITGSVSSVKTKDLTAFPVLDATQALQGRAAGVVVQSNNGGEPGAPINVKIRGNTSVGASSSPLIVVDGFVGATMPQPNDILSLEVLKDASSAAIYGSRGSNGVILVTTKKGKKGELVVEVNSIYSSQKTTNKLDLLNAAEFARYQQDVLDNVALTAGKTPATYSPGTEDTDWQDEIYRSGSTQNHQISFSGGSDNLNYYASGTYFKQDGIVVNSGFERATILSNFDLKANDKLKLGLNVFGGMGVKNGIPTQSTGSVTVGGDDVIALAFRSAPDIGIKDADGDFTTTTIGDGIENPYAVATERINEIKIDQFRANFYADYQIIEDLSFKTTFGLSNSSETEGLFLPSTLPITAAKQGGEATLENLRKATTLSENYLTYNKEVGQGNLTVLAGYSFQRNTSEYYGAFATGFPSNSFSFRKLDAGAVYLRPESYFSESITQSQFGRVNFDYADKYLITATVRRDGSSNFAVNEKYAFFPSFALAWRVSNESFLSGNETISNMKLRASYGLTGNQAISPYASLSRLEALYSSVDGRSVNAVTPQQPANPDLKWETSIQTNIGLDVGLLDGRVELTLDYYNIDTEDLILGNRGLPVYFGFTEPEILTNVGQINNSGFEISINTTNIDNDDFRWSSNLNWSTNKNEVVSLIDGQDLLGSAAPSYFSVDQTYILREGQPVGLFWGQEFAGVHQGGAVPEGLAGFSNVQPGDPLFVDRDGDGSIGSEDRTTIGDPNADFTFGFTNSLSYKNWDLNIFVQGAQGGEIFNMTNVQLFNGDANTTRDYYLNAWTSSIKSTTTPRVGNNSWREISSRFVEDGSYVRLKNVGVGYNLPSDMAEKAGMAAVRLSFSAQNLLTFTKYSGLDPEVNYYGGSGESNEKSNTAQGHDFGNYPTVRSYTFSVNLKF